MLKTVSTARTLDSLRGKRQRLLRIDYNVYGTVSGQAIGGLHGLKAL
jgi:hypothetical protein